MRLNSKLTWGLAWTGLALVLAVPSADFLTGQFGGRGNAVMLTSTTEPVVPGFAGQTSASPITKTSSVTTTVTKNGVTITPKAATAPTHVASTGAPVLDPVDKRLKSGKTLPDYISDGDGAPVVGTPTGSIARPTAPTQVATIDPTPAVVPPVPFPSRPPDVVRPALPKATARPTQPVVVVDEQALATQQDTMPDQLIVNDNAGPVPPAGIADDWRTARQRRLARYLEQQGLINDAAPDGRSSASVTIVQRPRSDYDPNGFYLSDGPNNSRAERRARIEQMLQEQDSGFTLF